MERLRAHENVPWVAPPMALKSGGPADPSNCFANNRSYGRPRSYDHTAKIVSDGIGKSLGTRDMPDPLQAVQRPDDAPGAPGKFSTQADLAEQSNTPVLGQVYQVIEHFE